MERIKTGAFNAVIHHKKTILILFGGMIIFSLFAMGFVSVNYDMAAYLPEDAVSTVALQKMGDEYGTGVPNARLMFEDVSLPEAISIKNELLSIDGVQDVLWLDSTHNLKEPLEAQDQKGAEAFYKDNNALYNVTLEAEKEISAMNSIREKFGDKVAMAGPAINIGAATDTSDEEVLLSTAVIVPMCFLVLFFTTTSWFEPFLFMGVIGVAILINAGTNIFLGEISFVTNAAQSILQLAVSMDYSIFLLHRFTEKRAEGLEIEEAMVEALKSSFSSITASGITTVIGFAALILMRFKIGPDMGIVMAKAIFISLLSVLLLMPVLVIYCYRLVEKTQHRSFLPSFEKLGNLVFKIKLPMMIIFLLLILPSFLAKDQNEFYYGSSMVFGEETTQVGRDTKKINDTFGKANNFVIMVPKGDIGKEVQLSQELRTIPQILEIISYVDTVGAQIPLEFLDKTTTSQLLSQNYSRMILVLDVDYEGEYAFGVVDQIKAVAEKYYGDSYYMAGETVNTYDLKTTIVADNPKVNAVAIIAVFLVLVIGLKSLMLPFLLVLTIETAIWVNMSVPYFTGEPMFFIAYLIVSSIQLGATVDYAILLTNRQLEERENMDRKAALIKTTMTTTGSIMTSGLIMTIGCLILGAVSKNEVLSQLGTLIGRGALLSMAAVIFVLPALLYYFDKIIEKTTKNVHFYKAKEEK